MGAVREKPLAVVRQRGLAHRHEQVAIAAKPGDVPAIKADHERLRILGGDLLIGLPVQARVDLPEDFAVTGGSVAVDVQANLAEVEGELHIRIVDFGERRLGGGQVVDPALDHRADVLVTNELGVGVDGELEVRPESKRPRAGREPVTVQALREMLDGSQKLCHAEPELRLGILGVRLQDVLQSLLAIGEFPFDEIFLSQRRFVVRE